MCFRRPVVQVNYIPLVYIRTGDTTIHIPKKLWIIDQRRFMSFREIFESKVSQFSVNEQYEKAGIEPVENASAKCGNPLL